jgi:hypothetical protein
MVSVGDSNGDQREVLAGLTVGDRIIVDPPAGLQDGHVVTSAAGAAK